MFPVLLYILYFLENRTTIGFLINKYDTLYSIYLLLSQGISVFLVIYVVITWSKYKNHGILLPLYFYSLCLVVCNFMAGGVMNIAVGLAYPTIAMMSLFVILSNNPTKLKKLISLLAYTFFVVMLIHFFDSLSTMDPERTTYIFQTESFVSFVMFIGLLYVGLDYYINKNKRLLTIYIVMFVLSTWFVFTATALIAALLFAGLFYIPILRKRLNSRTLAKNFVIYIVVFLLFVTAGLVMLETPWFTNFAIQTLGKTPDLSGRTLIWPQVLDGFKNSPIWGNGFSLDENKFYVVMKGAGFWFTAHNQILQTLYNSGIVGFGAFVLCVFSFSNSLRKTSDSRLSSFLQILFFSMMVNCLGESPQFIYIIEVMTVGSIVCQIDIYGKKTINCNSSL